MVAHMYVPALDNTTNLATTLSPFVVKEMIRNRMNYDGLIFTDALNMKGVTKYHAPGIVEVKAFLAGNDVLLYPANVPRAIAGMKKALEKGIIDTVDLEDRVRQILMAKYKLGLSGYAPLSSEGLNESLNRPEALILRKRLYEAALTLVRNEENLIPLRNLEKRKIAYIQIGTNEETVFEKNLKKYSAIKAIHLPTSFSQADVLKVKKALAKYNTVIFGVYNLSKSPRKKYGYNPLINTMAKELQGLGKRTVMTLFGYPYALTQVGDQHAVLMAYEAVPDAQRAAAMAIFGGLKVSGKLPVSAGDRFPEGTGIEIKEVIRFGFALPEEEGIDSYVLNKIDSLARHYIDKGAMPGCAILVGKGNSIIYEKGFGKTEYGNEGQEIDPYYHMYDLASVTKITATTLIAMKLVEEGSLKLDAPVEKYLSELKGSDKAKLTPRRLLQHNSGLPAWRPFYRDTYEDINRKTNDKRFYRTSRQDSFPLVVGPNLYGLQTLPDTIWEWIQGMTVKQTRKVRYSDIGMIMMGKILEKQVGTNLDRYARYKFYLPLGMVSTHYTPALKGIAHRCPPTLVDDYWRYAKLQGYVHDESAAILGGRTGHAGLFSNVYDMAKLLFMLKNGGEYGGERYFSPETIKTFTKQQLSNNRKGLGWDKPEIYANRTNPASARSSRSTYGHTGFTGTCVWVDPKNDLIYIFLSNRTFPRASNRLLMKENVRTKIMDQIYLAMEGESS
jgi:CubicO group peptidase (beta-lactamase class C family)